MNRYVVYGCYDNPPQVVVDVVDAESDEAAEQAIVLARAGEQGSGYFCDGASELEGVITILQNHQRASEKSIARAIRELAKEYEHYHEK